VVDTVTVVANAIFWRSAALRSAVTERKIAGIAEGVDDRKQGLRTRETRSTSTAVR
jgi:hypothetical protein